MIDMLLIKLPTASKGLPGPLGHCFFFLQTSFFWYRAGEHVGPGGAIGPLNFPGQGPLLTGGPSSLGPTQDAEGGGWGLGDGLFSKAITPARPTLAEAWVEGELFGV